MMKNQMLSAIIASESKLFQVVEENEELWWYTKWSK
jgi:hypothetical protein